MQDLTFMDCLREPIGNEEFVREFNRLNGTHLGIDRRAPIEKMVDQATGYQEVIDARDRDEMGKFVAFVYEFVWLPLSAEVARGG